MDYALSGEILSGPSVPAGGLAIPADLAAQLQQSRARGLAIDMSAVAAMSATEGLRLQSAAVSARRDARNTLLAETDWTQLPDSPFTAPERAAWATYRQALRDLDMNGTTWPSAPGEEA